jgi:thiamine transport system permease protein
MDADRPQVTATARRQPGSWSRLAVAASQHLARWLPLLFIACFLIYPLARILALGLAPLASSGWEGLAALAAGSDLPGLIAFTTGQAALSTALTLAVGLPAAYVFARFRFPGRDVLRALLTVPFVMPTVVVAAAFVAIIGSGGLLEQTLGALFGSSAPQVSLMRSLPAVLIAHVFYNVSVVVRIVGGFWANLDPRLEESARMLGAGRLRVFLLVTLPLLMPALAAAAILVFAFCFTSFGVVLILGGPRMATLEVEIYRQAVYMFNLPAAAFLALVQLLLTMAVMSIYTHLQARASRPLSLKPVQATQRQPSSRREWLLVAVLGGGVTLGLLFPLLVLAATSFVTPAGLGVDYWTGLFQDVRRGVFYAPPPVAIRNSLIFAFTTVALSLAVGIPAAYLIAGRDAGRGAAAPGTSSPVSHLQGAVELLFLLPLGTSAVTLGFGFIIALTWPVDLRASPLLIPIAHTLVALPLVTRTLLPSLRGMNPRWREAAALLGADARQVWLAIDLPILARAGLVAAAFAFAVSLGEFGATSLLARPDLPTVPVVIYSYLGQPGAMNQGQALAMSTLLMVLCGAGLLAIERLRVAGLGEF